MGNGMNILDGVEKREKQARRADFLEEGEHLLAFDSIEQGGDPAVVRATFEVVQDGARHKKGDMVSIRFQVYGSSYKGHAKQEREALMELVMEAWGLKDNVAGAAYYEKMLNASAPARGLLVKSDGYLKAPKPDAEGNLPKDKNGKEYRGWPVISFSNVPGQSAASIATQRAAMEGDTPKEAPPPVVVPTAAPVVAKPSVDLNLDSLLIPL